MRLIDADEALRELERRERLMERIMVPDDEGKYFVSTRAVKVFIENRPTVEPATSLGEWVKVDDSISLWECSICGSVMICESQYVHEQNFCTCCGAKMKERRNNNG